MRLSALALFALPALAAAIPASKRENWGKEKEHKPEPKHDDDDMKMDDHKDDHNDLIKGVFHFTSTYTAYAGPDQVINNSQVAVAGEPGAYGVYKFGINSYEDLICYVGREWFALEVTRADLIAGLVEHLGLHLGRVHEPCRHRHPHCEFRRMSTAAMMPLPTRPLDSQHQAAFGRAGPPRIAFPNPTIESPVDEQGRRTSFGCVQGPFLTGILANGSEFGECPPRSESMLIQRGTSQPTPVPVSPWLKSSRTPPVSLPTSTPCSSLPVPSVDRSSWTSRRTRPQDKASKDVGF